LSLNEFVAFDFETTGINTEHDAIIQMGAVRFRGGAPVDEFVSLVNPHRPLPVKISLLTGINDADLAEAPDLGDVLPRFLAFLGQSPLIAHNASFDWAFLQKALTISGFKEVKNPCLDTYELARLLLPAARSFALGSLAKLLYIPLKRPHQALEDARATGQLALKLLEHLAGLDRDLLFRINRWLEPSSWPWKGQVAEALAAASRTFGPAPKRGPFGLKPVDLVVGLFSPAAKEKEEEKTFRPLDSWELSLLLARGGGVARALEPFEYRDEQVQALQAVVRAFNEGKYLLVEAGTGTGKSLAYLIPAVSWAKQNDERVVISTHTITLQEQLWNKDIPLLKKSLPWPFEAALLKGRSNYLCLARLEELEELLEETKGRGQMRAKPESPDGGASAGLSWLSLPERLFLARLEVWLSQTETGDRSELRLGHDEEDLWRMVGADNTCPGNDCPHVNWCFVTRARAQASNADLILVNHSLLLSDTRLKNRLLPEHRHVVLDEAHHLEDVATNHLGVDLYQWEAERLLRGFDSGGGRGGVRTGLLNTLEHLLLAIPDTTVRQNALQSLATIRMALVNLGAANENFFRRLGEWVKERREKEREAAGEEEQGWSFFTIPEEDADLTASLQEEGQILLALVDALLEKLKDFKESYKELLADRAGARGRLDRYLAYLVDYREKVRSLTSGVAGFVRWIEWPMAEKGEGERVNSNREREGRPRPSRGGALRAAPIEVGELLSTELFSRLRAAVLTSATLSAAVGRNPDPFAHIKARLGLDRLEAERVLAEKIPSPFNYSQQSLLLINRDLPAPNKVREQEYLEGAAAFIKEVVGLTGGRTMVLFTSHRSLRYVYQRLAPELQKMGLTLLGHSIDGSRERVLEEFKENPNSILFGASSFWEGVDLPGELLTCVIMVRLPFQPPVHPVQQARQNLLEKKGLPAFQHLSLPEAILRFKQGFGRLIRRKTDYGVLVVLDPRLDPARGGYGQSFLNSIARLNFYAGGQEEVLRRLAAWFHGPTTGEKAE